MARKLFPLFFIFVALALRPAPVRAQDAPAPAPAPTPTPVEVAQRADRDEGLGRRFTESLTARAALVAVLQFNSKLSVFAPLASDPVACGASYKGIGYFNTASNVTKVCNGTSWQTFSTSAAAAGGSNTQVQFNDSSAFGGDAGLTYNKTTDTLTGVNLTLSGACTGCGGVTVNATDGAVPYRSSSTAFSDSPLLRIDASTVALKNSTTATAYRVYNTDDGAGNADFLTVNFTTTANKATIKTAATGAGAPRNIRLQADGGVLELSDGNEILTMSGSSTSIRLAGTNGYDLGGPSNTFRSIYAGTALVAPALNLDETFTAAGTTGAQTINKTLFSVNFAAAATSLVVTNSTVAATSGVVCTVNTNDATMKSVAAVPASGSVTLFASAAATAETRVTCNVWN